MAGSAEKERQRRYPRYAVEGRGIRARTLSMEVVELENLSIGGVCVHTGRDLEDAGAYLLLIPDRTPALALRCSVVWKRVLEKGGDGVGGFAAGLRFTNPSSEEIVRLKDFMRSAGEPDGKKLGDEYPPSPLRFFMRERKKALLTCPETMEVKKISKGGMLAGSIRSWELEGRYRMRVLLSGEREPIRMTGRIASVLAPESGAPGYFGIGIEFLDMEPADRARLDSFLQNL